MAVNSKRASIAEQATKDLIAGIVKWSVWSEKQVFADAEMMRFVSRNADLIALASKSDYAEMVAGLAHKAVHEIATEKPYVGASECLACKSDR